MLVLQGAEEALDDAVGLRGLDAGADVAQQRIIAGVSGVKKMAQFDLENDSLCRAGGHGRADTARGAPGPAPALIDPHIHTRPTRTAAGADQDGLRDLVPVLVRTGRAHEEVQRSHP